MSEENKTYTEEEYKKLERDWQIANGRASVASQRASEMTQKYNSLYGNVFKTGTRENIGALAGEIADMNYSDWANGDEYKDLAKRYSDQGRMAMDDTIGQVSARTGGLASSYAVGAANQAYNGYMQKLEDAARSLYDNERAEKKDNLSIAQGIYAQDYREKRDSIADSQWQQQFNAQNSQWQQQFNAQNSQWQQQYNNSLIDKTIRNFSDNLYSQIYYGGDVSWEQVSQSGELPVGFTEADFNRIRNQALEDKGNKDKSDSDAKSAEAIQNIENYLAAGMSMSQIAKSHKDWIADSGYGMDYWNQLEKSIIAAKTPAVEEPEFRPVSTDDDITYKKYCADLAEDYESFSNKNKKLSSKDIQEQYEQKVKALFNNIYSMTGNYDYVASLIDTYFPWVKNLSDGSDEA